MTTGGLGSGSRFQRPIVVGLLTPYWSFFDDHFPADYRPAQDAYALGLAEALREHGLQVTSSGLVDGEAAATLARQRFLDAGVEVVVVAATMAAPPTFGAQALDGFTGPIVVWDDRRASRLARDVDEVEATRVSSMLGSVMLANVMGRDGHDYLTVTTDGDVRPIVRAIAGAAAANAVRGARLGLLGGVVPGYGDVVLDERQAAALGIDLVPIDGSIIAEALAASREGVAALLPGMTLTDAAAPLLERSMRVHRFLRQVVDIARIDALALNCHSEVLRWSEELGVVSCLGSSLLWSAGVPVACTGDGATAVALMMAARISGSAQYCEGYVVESETGELVVSSCGMADLSLKSDEPARLCANELYPGRHGMGIATRFDFAPGPATIAAFGPRTASLPGRLVISVGDLSGRGFAHLNGPSGTVAFDRPGSGAASTAWIDVGPAHHLALIRGDRSEEFRAACRFLGVQLIEVGPEGRIA